MKTKIFFSTCSGLFSIIALLVGSGPGHAVDPVVEIDADLEISGEVKGTLKVGDTGSPNSISGDDGDLYIEDQLEVDGAVSVDGNLFRVSPAWNYVSITESSNLSGYLLVGGDVGIKEVGSVPSEESEYAKFYSKETGGYVEMFALNEDGTYTQLTSHADPNVFDPSAVTSFADPNIEVPFSFHHGNLYIGKGAVVDLAALVAEVERMTGRDLAVEYDLPPDEIRALEDRQARLVQRAKESILEEDPEVEIAIGDAWEEVPVTELVQSSEQVTEYIYDLNALTVSPITVERTVLSEVETGETIRRLKEHVRFDETTGTFSRKRTVDDVQLESPPDVHLPQWIVDRLPPQ